MAVVRVDGEERVAKLAGRLRGRFRPVAGDEVDVTIMDDGTARIDRIDDRRTQLVRAQRLGRGDQVLVANADVLVVVAAAADPPLRRGLIDRLLVAAWAGEMEAVLVITKADLAEQAEEPPELVLAAYADLGYPGAIVDARSPAGATAVRALIGGRLAAFAGHSGVGKSTLVNSVTGGAQATGVVNEVIGRGRHTTTAARLIHGVGIEVIDTPGHSRLLARRAGRAGAAVRVPGDRRGRRAVPVPHVPAHRRGGLRRRGRGRPGAARQLPQAARRAARRGGARGRGRTPGGVSAAIIGAADADHVTVQPAGSALDLLAAGLGQARATMDGAAHSIAQDPFDVDAILDLSTAALGFTAMARAIRVVADTQSSLIDALA